MSGLLMLYILINLHNTFVECIIPGIASELRVRTLDEKLVERKRQDTMDMCRIFTEQTEKLNKISENSKGYQIKKRSKPVHRRAKRQTGLNALNPMLNVEDARRVENIVDKVYDDLLEKGEKIEYRRMNVDALERNTTSQVPGRRFNFAPQILTGPQSWQTPFNDDGTSPPGKTPRFKLSIVPYFIDRKTYDTHLTDMIVKAFDYFEKATCIRLQRLRDRPTDMESLQNVEWLYITNPTGIKQCVHSNERAIVKGVQMIVLGYDCMSLGDIVHEVMHILGFSHEHVRPDRDQFVSILWDNIKPGYKKYFERLELPDGENTPYDYASVLHYPSRAFSKNGQVTIVAQNGIKIGQREGLSEMDVEKISTTYSSECVKRNRQYLLKTCPSVVKAETKPPKVSQQDIEQYYDHRLWAFGIVNYKLKDRMEFTHDEKENILAVIRHIETETCIEFRDLSLEDDEYDNEGSDVIDEVEEEEEDLLKSNTTNHVGNTTGNTSGENANVASNGEESKKGEVKTDNEGMHTIVSLNIHGSDKDEKKDEDESDKDADNEIADATERLRSSKNFFRKKKSLDLKGKKSTLKKKSLKRSVTQHRKKQTGKPISPARRHATNILTFTRSPRPGCACPETPGVPADSTTIEINADCFNSVNILLHLFVHILGLDHQHNSHDRDSYLHIAWDQLTDDIKMEMKEKLPPAASAGFAYDYQSVMHYPFLQIKDGRTNIMYPIWNDGWAMGNWQGLSSTDVQKLNLLYKKQCSLRRHEAEAASKRSALK